MRVKQNDESLTVKAVAGTYDVLLAFDLAEEARAGCLGFSIERTDLSDGNKRRWLPNMLRFKSDTGTGPATTANAPLQAFSPISIIPGTSSIIHKFVTVFKLRH